MSNLFKSKFLLGVMLVAVLVVAGVAVSAKPAQADCAITMTLRLGAVGAEVQCMQSIVGATPDGKFGPMTLASVKAWQAGHPPLVADGVVGPLTRAAMLGVSGTLPAGCQAGWAVNPYTGESCTVTQLPAGCLPGYLFSPTTSLPCTSTTTPPVTDGGLTGGAGDITLTLAGDYSSERVGEGDKDAKVIQVDVEADANSDVSLGSAKVEFFQSSTADDRDLPDYVSEVTVWLDGVEVGRESTSTFTEATTNYFSKSINLSDAVIKAGKTGKLVVSVSANKSLDSGDIDSDAWQVDILNIRFTDGNGVTTTTTGSAAVTAGAGTYGQLFDFASFATASGAELRITLEDDAINDVHLLDVDDVNDTSHPITSILMKATGSKVWVDEMVSSIGTAGQVDESVIIISSWIEVGGVRISDKEDVPAGGAVTYDKLDHTIAVGTEEEWIFWVEVQDTDGALDDGDTVQLTVDVSGTVAQDGAGETLTAAGSDADGGAHLMYDNGIRLTGTSQTATSSTGGDNANDGSVKLTLLFDVFNFGDVTLYIPDGDTLTGTPSTSATTTAPSTTEEVGYHIQTAGTVTPGTNDISAILSETDDDLTLGTNAYELRSGKTGTFSLQVTIATDANPSIDNVSFRALLAGLGWATSDVATAAVVYTANLTDYKTDYAMLND